MSQGFEKYIIQNENSKLMSKTFTFLNNSPLIVNIEVPQPQLACPQPSEFQVECFMVTNNCRYLELSSYQGESIIQSYLDIVSILIQPKCLFIFNH